MTDLVKLGYKMIKEDLPESIHLFYSLPAFFGKMIFATRVKKGITQDDLAKLVGVEPTTIHKIEGSSSDISLSVYETVFKTLDITYYDVSDAIKEFVDDFNEA